MPDADWIKVMEALELAEGEMMAVQIGDRRLAIYRLEGGDFCATDGICTHEYAELCEGWLEGHEVECPLHGGRFDVRSGKGLCAPIDRDLETFEVRVEDGAVLVKVPAQSDGGTILR